MSRARTSWPAALLGCAILLVAQGSQAQLFSDNEARRAILDLRQRLETQRETMESQRQTVETQRQTLDAQRQTLERQTQELQRATEDATQLRRSLLDLQNQIETLRAELARLRGQDEVLARDLSEVQRRQRDLAQGVDDRLRRFEPTKVTQDGIEFAADPAEVREFEAALATFRRSEFAAAQTAFANFVRRWPQSGYLPAALFWLGNAQYATRDYKPAIDNFRALISTAPNHPRAPEAVLSIANCQIELKDSAGARQTLSDLMKAYPQSEAAAAAKERLARLR